MDIELDSPPKIFDNALTLNSDHRMGAGQLITKVISDTAHYKLTQTGSTLQLQSDTRIPLEPKGELLEARLKLREALKQISPEDRQILQGTYDSHINGFFDVENIVFYNIGTGTFRDASYNGLQAVRRRSLKANDKSAFPHQLTYQFISPPSVPAAAACTIEFIPSKFSSVFDVWWACTQGTTLAISELKEPYGVHVELQLPYRLKNPANNLKKIIDGIISSFQSDSTPNDQAVERLAKKHKINPTSISERLINPQISALRSSRTQRLLLPYRDGVQWHPADNACEECTLLVNLAEKAHCKAYLYSL